MLCVVGSSAEARCGFNSGTPLILPYKYTSRRHWSHSAHAAAHHSTQWRRSSRSCVGVAPQHTPRRWQLALKQRLPTPAASHSILPHASILQHLQTPCCQHARSRAQGAVCGCTVRQRPYLPQKQRSHHTAAQPPHNRPFGASSLLQQLLQGCARGCTCGAVTQRLASTSTAGRTIHTVPSRGATQKCPASTCRTKSMGSHVSTSRGKLLP